MNRVKLNDLASHLLEVREELTRASEMYDSFHNAHEGFAVLLEEVDELWEIIKLKPQNTQKIKQEAIQICAMAMRIIMDCVDHE